MHDSEARKLNRSDHGEEMDDPCSSPSSGHKALNSQTYPLFIPQKRQNREKEAKTEQLLPSLPPPTAQPPNPDSRTTVHLGSIPCVCGMLELDLPSAH